MTCIVPLRPFYIFIPGFIWLPQEFQNTKKCQLTNVSLVGRASTEQIVFWGPVGKTKHSICLLGFAQVPEDRTIKKKQIYCFLDSLGVQYWEGGLGRQVSKLGRSLEDILFVVSGFAASLVHVFLSPAFNFFCVKHSGLKQSQSQTWLVLM